MATTFDDIPVDKLLSLRESMVALKDSVEDVDRALKGCGVAGERISLIYETMHSSIQNLIVRMDTSLAKRSIDG